MQDEKRRYFRIDETIGIAYEVLDPRHPARSMDSGGVGMGPKMADILDVIEEQDAKIEHLLMALEDQNPTVAEIIGVFNQKLERVVNHLLMESHTVSRIAHKVKEANISACGVGFVNNEYVEDGTNLRIQLSLSPGDLQVETNGRVISCAANADGESYYWRIDFFGMSKGSQEALIQHIVRTQGSQLKFKD